MTKHVFRYILLTVYTRVHEVLVTVGKPFLVALALAADRAAVPRGQVVGHEAAAHAVLALYVTRCLYNHR